MAYKLAVLEILRNLYQWVRRL